MKKLSRFLMNYVFLIPSHTGLFIHQTLSRACCLLGTLLGIGIQSWKSPTLVLITVNLPPDWLGDVICYWSQDLCMTMVLDLSPVYFSFTPEALLNLSLPLSSFLSHSSFFTPAHVLASYSMWKIDFRW